MATELTPVSRTSAINAPADQIGRLGCHRLCRSPALGPEEWEELRKKLNELMQKEKAAQNKAGLGGVHNEKR
jgi:hypothetical protein